MSKFKVLNGKAVCKILSDKGFIQVQQKGSHIIMQKKIDSRTITVPVPNHSQIKIGTLQSIIRQSELSKADFQK